MPASTEILLILAALPVLGALVALVWVQLEWRAARRREAEKIIEAMKRAKG